jgi:hypothetical protein
VKNLPLCGLAVLALLLAATVALEIADFSAPPPSGGAAPRTAAALSAASAAPVPTADRMPALVAAILARPLFEPSRRPPAPASASIDATTTTLPRLAGIMVSPGRRAVIFQAPGGGKPLTLVEGEKVGGYLIQSISADRVVVVTSDGSHVLRPDFDPKTAKAEPVAASLQVVPMLAAPSPVADAPGRIDLPGLHGRPLGLVGTADDAAQSAAIPFPSLAAPAGASR